MMVDPKFILKGIGGSHAHGLATESSDEDLIGVFAWPSVQFWSLNSPAESIVRHEPQDEAYHELKKFCSLAVKSNPTVLETLWLDTYSEKERGWGDDLIALRGAFLSKHYVMSAYMGYAESQFRKVTMRASEYEDVSGLSSGSATDSFRNEDNGAGRAGEAVQDVLRGAPAAVSRESQGEANSRGCGGVSTLKEGPLDSQEVGNLSRHLRTTGEDTEQRVQDLQGADGRSGPRSRDGRVAGNALSEVQPGDGTLQRQSGTTPRSSELPPGPLRSRERKAAIHALRLLEQGRNLYEWGILNVRVENPERYREWSTWSTERLSEEWVKQWAAFVDSDCRLPEEPNYDAINSYLRSYRRAH